MVTVERIKLLTILKAIYAVVPECRMHLVKEGMRSISVDFANVCIVRIFLPKVQITAYSTQEQPLGIDTGKLKTAISVISSESVILSISKGNKIDIVGEGSGYKMINIDEREIRKDPREPKLEEPDNIITIPGPILSKNINDACNFGEHVQFHISKDRLALATGTDETQWVSEIKGVSVKSKESTSTILSLDYLKDFGKIFADAEVVRISAKTDYVMVFECTINHVQITYLIAPRIPEAKEFWQVDL